MIITSAAATVDTPYGAAGVDWKLENGTFSVTVQVPLGADCELVLPSGETRKLTSGVHTASCGI